MINEILYKTNNFNSIHLYIKLGYIFKITNMKNEL